MQENGKNILIGVFVLAAICLIVWIVLFLHPQVGDEGQVLTVKFANIEKIEEGTRVSYAGKPVGQVLEIREIPDARSQPTDESGVIYTYDVILGIDTDVEVYNTDKISVVTTGLFGERNIDISPVRPPPGVTPHLVTPGEILYAKSGDQMSDAFGQISNLGTTVSEAFNKISALVDDNSNNVHEAILAFRGAMDEMGTTFSDVNQMELIGTLKGAFEEFENVMGNVHRQLGELEENGFWTNLHQLASNINDGKGTLGRLLGDDGLYLELMSLLGKADTVMNDISNYGILFQNNRDWKRHRARRLNCLRSLTSPQGFQQYFNCELDQISTALMRVSALLDELRCCHPCMKPLCDPCFSEQFANLLRKVKSLEDRLGLYNEQLVEEQMTPCRRAACQ